MEKYDTIGKDYNHTRKADPFLASRIRHHLGLLEGKRYLDIGCGTGNYTLEVWQPGIELIGMDPSEEMLNQARSRSKDITWMQGRGEEIPLKNNSIDGAFAVLTMHHWESIDKGISELHRVLKPNGRLVIFTSRPKQMAQYWLNHYFPLMMMESILQMPAYTLVKETMEVIGFEINELEKYFIREDLQDRFLFSGKHNPERYLDQEFRKGISSFRLLTKSSELKDGLDTIQSDIESGSIQKVMSEYESELGDYLFIIARKTDPPKKEKTL